MSAAAEVAGEEQAQWIFWSPPWAPHVQGRYEMRRYDAELKRFEPQLVVAVCTNCGHDWRASCESGLVRDHISRFAAIHLHQRVGEF